MENRKFKLDNTALIHMASKNKHWSNIFRLSVTLYDDINPQILQKALEHMTPRFPTIIASIHKGFFWYYQKPVTSIPNITKDTYLLKAMSKKELERCATRVMYSDKSINVELFHSITDGKGGIIFLKSLVYEYLKIKEKVNVSNLGAWDILSTEDRPEENELQDAYRNLQTSMKPSNAQEQNKNIFQFKDDQSDYLHLNKFIFDINDIKPLAKTYHASLTVLISAIIMKAMINIQKEKETLDKQKIVKLFLPIDLRNIMGQQTLRNFVFYIKPEINPKQDQDKLMDIIESIKKQMNQGLQKENLKARIEKNVKLQNSLIISAMPLFLKEFMLKQGFKISEKTTSLTVSNMGIVEMPEQLNEYIQHFDCLLNTRSDTPYNCGIISYDGKLYVNFIRNTEHALLERAMAQIISDLSIVHRIEKTQYRI
ncbi:hypothetical protein HYE69_09390 [Staphylococcus sp. GSSP0090]|nr:hypothetical protein [Staphylococcus sp. GSSP0090]